MTPTPDTTDRRPLKVVFVAAHDSLGGAARAAYRVFDAIRTHFPDRIDITFRVIHKTRDDEQIVGGKASRSRLEYAQYFLRTRFRKYLPRKPFISPNTLLHSQALYPTGLGREINRMTPDVILLGWLGNATLSIAEVGRLRAPVVWRLSDMWMFSGAEHYTDTGRYRVGYSKASRPPGESGPDIDRETFRRKRRQWKKPSHVVALTRWLEREAKSSVLSATRPTHVIPVPMDTGFWAPTDQKKARNSFGIEQDAVVVMFGAGNGTSQPHKGAGLLFDALPLLKSLHAASGDTRPLRAIVFGEDGPTREVGGVPVQFLGRLDDEGLRRAYSAADVFVVPSRLEAFGQVAAEAQCCGTPVVAFDNSGLADVVEDRVTGALAQAFDPQSLADAIHWVIEDSERTSTLGAAATERARRLWDPKTVAESYVAVLEQAAAEKN
ncbi:glycosyltransferase [Pontimonas salivibrio]|uniref:Glycosyltransferase n=1 Tax=Pontimonas salivibrio TaxID=1159327 RepID=A0A2L2BSK7_9MICO|nr:glycosyltransferase [Pontimonas salivibrio]AVG24648.1 glycosyltransferase [Pontimonas salivibrio]